MKAKCFDWKVAAGLALTGLTVALVVPRLSSIALPSLVMLACPLSMGAMMWGMRRGTEPQNTPSLDVSVEQRLRRELAATEARRAELQTELGQLREPTTGARGPAATERG